MRDELGSFLKNQVDSYEKAYSQDPDAVWTLDSEFSLRYSGLGEFLQIGGYYISLYNQQFKTFEISQPDSFLASLIAAFVVVQEAASSDGVLTAKVSHMDISMRISALKNNRR